MFPDLSLFWLATLNVLQVKQTSQNCEIPRQSFVNEFAALSLQFQLRTNCISCKQVSMISPLQLLLFGSRNVEAIGADKVRLDKMYLNIILLN